EDTKLRCTPLAAHAGGTLPYMPPEQLATLAGVLRPLDARADVFALGVLLFELLTGQLPCPIPTGSPDEALPKLLEERWRGPTDPGGFNPDLSPAVRAIIRHCLEPNPELRYRDAAALRDDLQRQLNHQPLEHIREPSWKESAGKWLRRHPGALSRGSLLV